MMRKAIGAALLIVVLVVWGSVASAAPVNNPHASELTVDCGDGVQTAIVLENGSKVVFLADGRKAVAKQVNATFTVRVVLVSSGAVLATFEEPFNISIGGGIPSAKLTVCSFTEEFTEGPVPLDAEAAAEFDIDPSLIGQNVVFSGTGSGEARVLITGRR